MVYYYKIIFNTPGQIYLLSIYIFLYKKKSQKQSQMSRLI